MKEYRRGAHTVFEIHLHLVWTTKYRRGALTGEVATRVRDLICEICGQHEVTILKGHVGERSSASVCVDTATSNDKPTDPMVEGEDVVQVDGGISAFAQAVLGTTSVGARVFLLQQRQCDR
jgi:hypothetical protein